MKERLSVFYFILICFLIYGCASLSNQHQNQPPIQPENQPEKQSSSELQQTFSAPMETEGDRALVDPNKLRFDLKVKKETAQIVWKVVQSKSSGIELYGIFKKGKVEYFSCQGYELELASSVIVDGFIFTKKYGSIKTGIHQKTKKLAVWLTPKQFDEFGQLKK